MGRYGVPRPVRCFFGVLVGASVFAATSVVMFSLAASAGSNVNLLSPLTNTVSNVSSGLVGTVGNTANTLTGPSGVVCQLLCSVTTPPAPPSQQKPLGSTLQCLSGTTCITDPNPTNNRSTNNNSTSNNGTSTIQQPVPNPAPVTAPGHGTAGVDDPPALTAPTGPQSGSLTVPPPPSITLPSATSGINFGKAPFLWPLFLGLDVLGAGAVVLALRKTWSRPVAD
jgi:hypothetical protein